MPEGVAKRPTKSASADGPVTKKAKTISGSEEVMSDAEMRSKYNKDTLSKLTVPVLREWLKAKGETKLTGLKKDELKDKVEKYFETKMEID
jgi:ATP-dependent DNA helicase 2 subunit 1